MKITAALKAYMLEKGWINASTTDEDIRKSVSTRILSGELKSDEFARLSAETAPNGSAAVATMVATEVAKAMEPLSVALKALTEKMGTPSPAPAPTPPAPTPTPPVTPPVAPTHSAEEMDKTIQAALEKRLADLGLSNSPAGGGGMTLLLSRSAEILSRPDVRVKSAAESYTHNRKDAFYPAKTRLGTKHAFAGEPASCAGVPLYHPSERDKAISCAFWKWSISKAHSAHEIPRVLHMTDHEKDLLNWALRNSSWAGLIRGEEGDETGCIRVDRRKLSDFEVKALLDDATSGGLEIAPIEFDDALITIPVLYGELFPLVNVVNITRGRRIEGAVIGNPTFTSNVNEGTAITPFTTTAFVSAFDTTIFTAVSAFEIGLDFEEDSPTNVGQIIIQKYGEKAMEYLDRVIAVGNGTGEPEGVLTSTAPTVINSDFGITGPPTIGDYEGLMFGVAKQFRQTKGSRNIFLANDTTYRRARGIAVGPGDERRVFGMDHGSYQLFDHPYKIQNSIPNTQGGFFNMGYYRMYRRLGMNIRIETAGQTLALKNTKMIVVRMRYGGKLELGGAGCVINDFQQ